MKKFDLAERTTKFGISVLLFIKNIPSTPISTPLIVQLVKSATSIGANYSEADCAESRKDFEHKLGIWKKEARETQYWLEMILHLYSHHKDQIHILKQEAHELQLIFISIIKKSNLKQPVSH